MPRAEVGSTKWQANKLKSKGLTRLRWYCQVCQKGCRDENGFRCHVQSESHVRQMLVVGQNQKQELKNYSDEFRREFLQVLRTSHGTKPVEINKVYNQYISDPHHPHMNATEWNSLTNWAHYLGREGICKVEVPEDSDGTASGIKIAWIDNSPEALRRQEAIRKKERQDKGDEEREQRRLREQVERSRAEHAPEKEIDPKAKELKELGGPMKLSFGTKPTLPKPTASSSAGAAETNGSPNSTPDTVPETVSQTITQPAEESGAVTDATQTKMELGMNPGKPKNVFAEKNNPLAGKKAAFKEPPKKMSQAERIMKEEMERKRKRGSNGLQFDFKRPRV